MKHSLCLVAIFAWLAVFFAPASGAVPGDGKTAYAANAAAEPAMAQMPDPTDESAYDDDDDYDYDDEPFGEERVTISDPLEPVNRIAHVFNDRMYFWVLKPAAVVYKAVAPEPVRISMKNLHSHLGYPARFLSCLLQTDFTGAAEETGRFIINTLWGIGGLMDPAAGENINLEKQDTDLGETLGVYGVGHGFYIVWPFLGPSSPRDSVDIAGEYLLDPLSYFTPWYTSLGEKPLKIINNTSLRIGDYEALLEAAIDPYVAIRDGYIQYRMKEVKARKARSLLFHDGDGARPAADEPPKN